MSMAVCHSGALSRGKALVESTVGSVRGGLSFRPTNVSSLSLKLDRPEARNQMLKPALNSFFEALPSYESIGAASFRSNLTEFVLPLRTSTQPPNYRSGPGFFPGGFGGPDRPLLILKEPRFPDLYMNSHPFEGFDLT